MAFRKRNVGVQRSPGQTADVSIDGPASIAASQSIPGVRPSPLTGQPTTSTGTITLDNLLGGHAGLALGSSLLIEEGGTTDFAGALLRFYAAEGLIQGHTVHVVGVGEQWVRELPGLVGAADASVDQAPTSRGKVDEEKMKIAWRYERLGQHDAARAGREVPSRDPSSNITSNAEQPHSEPIAFCHTFDLAKRLAIPANASPNLIPIQQHLLSASSPFAAILSSLSHHITNAAPTTIHRVVIPTILSPALYSPQAGHPHNFLHFLHSLRSLLRQYSSRLTVMMTLPLELYHRSSGLVRWAELLSDGVIELTPFPHLMDASNSLAESGGARGNEEQPQGMLKLHKLPVTTDRGGGGAGSGVGDDLAFTLSRRKFVIKPFSLPPMEGDTEAQRGEAEGGALGKATKVDIEF